MVVVMIGKIEGEGMDGGVDVLEGRVGLDWVDLGLGLID